MPYEEKLEIIVERTQAQQEDEMLAAERKQVPKAIKRLENQLAKRSDPQLRDQLERTLEKWQRQLADLDQAANVQQIDVSHWLRM